MSSNIQDMNIEQNKLVGLLTTSWRNELNELLRNHPTALSVGFSRRIVFKNRSGINVRIKSVKYSREDKVYLAESELYHHKNKILQRISIKFSNKSLNKMLKNIFSRLDKVIICPECDNITYSYYPKEKKCEECIFGTIIHEFNNKKEFCAVCHEETKVYNKLKCGHTFHYKCSETLDKCPLCRVPITKNIIGLIANESDTD